jgi:hypothetical protein
MYFVLKYKHEYKTHGQNNMQDTWMEQNPWIEQQARVGTMIGQRMTTTIGFMDDYGDDILDRHYDYQMCIR